MRLAVFNSFPYHYEMFAHILDYCKNHNQEVNVYTNTTNDYGWLSYYEEVYAVKEWYPIHQFHPEDYDCVILATDDDYAYGRFWNGKTHVVVIEHGGRRQLSLPAQSFIQIRQLKLRTPPSDSNTWAIPVWDNKLYTKSDRLTVVSVGRSAPRDPRELQRMFSNFDDIHFIWIDRTVSCSTGVSNIEVIRGMDTENMVKCIGEATYILLLPNGNDDYVYHSISASIPLGYSVGTPVLMLEPWVEAYELPGLIGIPDDSSIELTHPTAEQCDAFQKGRTELLQRCDRVLTEAMLNHST
jgi:hypothetical protein